MADLFFRRYLAKITNPTLYKDKVLRI